MRLISLTTIIAIGLAYATSTAAHPATERYIPIGQSPGISNVKSYIGPIQAVSSTADGFVMQVEGASQAVTVSDRTKIFLDTGRGRTNLLGTEADCQAGRMVEVYLHDDGTAYWVKISTT